MKMRIIFLLALPIFLSSCWKQSFAPPVRTQAVNTQFETARRTLAATANLVNLASKIDLWIAAPSDVERDHIEDLYFPNYKIRLRGDTIQIVENQNSSMLILTNSHRFNDANAAWRLFSQGDTLTIKSFADQSWRVEHGVGGFLGMNLDVTVARVEQTKFFNLAGSGHYVSVDKKDTEKVYFRVEKSLNVLADENHISLTTVSSLFFMAGELIFSTSILDGAASEDIARAVIHKYPHYTLSYRGFTEMWPIYYY